MATCNFCCANNRLNLPNKKFTIKPGDIIVIGRFSSIRWKVGYGWFSFDGNRKICGWYMKQIEDPKIVKPIQEIDLYDVYIVQPQ